MDKKVVSSLFLFLVIGFISAAPYMEALTDPNTDVDAYIPQVEVYDDMGAADRYMTFPQINKRNCKRRGARCQYYGESECCNGACKCNIWGQNCKCLRPGLFATWG
ncbi:hypothetical protein RvY_09187 [Ramazzottius varieornatus]|uniref:Uncharacterized protein n=1 Tax=Ramazzottius varieornatus TaxID=947166 RepID=A0A1D1VAY9_RAMVA|nr:hypothetical protein RvY_09187 [Ramazzottius varieornatus]